MGTFCARMRKEEAMKSSKLFSLILVLILLATLTGAADGTPLAAACVPGAAYDFACDVDHDGDVDIFDVQLAASHWGQTGTYNIYPAMLPKTGQTTTYAAGDDGDLQKGVAWPNPRFTDNSNGTVTDNLTGLIWLKNADCANGTRSWTTALSDVASLNSGGTMNSNNCGDTSNGGSHQTDWRLPNGRELLSLIDYGRYDPALPSGHPFLGTRSLSYWTSTTYVSSTFLVWVVNLREGQMSNTIKTSTLDVWPVRGGQ